MLQHVFGISCSLLPLPPKPVSLSSHPLGSSLFPSLQTCLPLPPSSAASFVYFCALSFLLHLPSVFVSSPRVHDPAGLHWARPDPVAALPAARSGQAARVHQGESCCGEETPVCHLKPRQRGRQHTSQSGGPLPGQGPCSWTVGVWVWVGQHVEHHYLFTCCMYTCKSFKIHKYAVTKKLDRSLVAKK